MADDRQSNSRAACTSHQWLARWFGWFWHARVPRSDYICERLVLFPIRFMRAENSVRAQAVLHKLQEELICIHVVLKTNGPEVKFAPVHRLGRPHERLTTHIFLGLFRNFAIFISLRCFTFFPLPTGNKTGRTNQSLQWYYSGVWLWWSCEIALKREEKLSSR